MKKILIGEMAKLHNVSEQTLRYYDEIGLFKPFNIDKDNNYRYYSIEQFAHLDSILFLKSLGMPLKDIKKLFDNRDLNSILLLLEEKEKSIAKEIQTLKNRQKSIRTKVKTIYQYMRGDEINQNQIKDIPEREIIYLHLDEDMDAIIYEYGIKELSKTIGGDLSLFDGNIGIIMDEDQLKAGEYKEKGIALVFDKDIIPNHKLNILGGGEYAARTFIGSYQQGENSFKKLFQWIEENGYTITGDGLMLTITDAAFSNYEDEYITEIQIPVKKP